MNTRRISTASMSALIIGLLAFPIPSFADAFVDVGTNNEHYLAAEYLSSLSIIEGYGGNTFSPYREINRAEFTALMVRASYGEPSPTQYRNCLPDVGEEWFARYVCYAYDQGWVEGYPDHSFHPAQIVNRAEALKMATNAFQYRETVRNQVQFSPYDDVSTDDWFGPYAQFQHEYNLNMFFGDTLHPDWPVKRGEALEMVYRHQLMNQLGAPQYTSDEERCQYLSEHGLGDQVQDHLRDRDQDREYDQDQDQDRDQDQNQDQKHGKY